MAFGLLKPILVHGWVMFVQVMWGEEEQSGKTNAFCHNS